MKNYTILVLGFFVLLGSTAQAQKSKSIVLQLNNQSYSNDNNDFVSHGSSLFEVGRLINTGNSDIGYSMVFDDTLKVSKASSYSLSGKGVRANSICFDNNNNYYVLLENTSDYTLTVAKYNASHTIQWQKEYYGVGLHNAFMRYNPVNDRIYIGAAIGVTGGGYTAFLIKIKTDGTVEASKTVSKETVYSYIADFTIDSNGDIIVCGGTSSYNTNSKNDFFLIKVDKDLGSKWTKTFSGTNYCVFNKIVTDASNNIYLNGMYNYINTIVKANSNGIISKVKTISTNLSEAHSMSFYNDTLVVSYKYRDAVFFKNNLDYIHSFTQEKYDYQSTRYRKSFVGASGKLYTSVGFEGNKAYCLQYAIHDPHLAKGCKSTDQSISITNHTFTESNETNYAKAYTVSVRTGSISINTMTTASKVHCVGGCDVKPVALFDHTVTGNILNTTNNSTGSSSYKWKFSGPSGYSNTGTSESFSNIYFGDEGTYTLCLKAFSSCNDSNEKCITINYTCKKPVTVFSSFSSGPNSVSFVNEATGGQSYTWEFGNGKTSTSDKDTVVHVYDNTNKVNVCLTATNGCGSTKVCKDVTPKCEIAADFSFTNAAFVGTFTDKSTWANEWAWNFGDGETSTVKNPVHDFKKSGDYNVCLIAKNICGTSTSVCKKMTFTSTGISPMKYDEIAVYPNPSNGIISINSQVRFVSYSIYSMSGLMLQSDRLEGAEIQVDKLPVGFYTLLLSSKDGTPYYTRFIRKN